MTAQITWLYVQRWLAEEGPDSVSEHWALGHDSVGPLSSYLLPEGWGCAFFTSVFTPWAPTEQMYSKFI